MSPQSPHPAHSRWWLLILAGILVALAAGLLGRPTPVAAKFNYLTAFRTAYPAVTGTTLDSCNVCHTSAIPALNAYGMDYRANGHSLAAIEPLDSDNDGAINIVEIRALTFPGDASSYPAATPTPTATTAPINPTATPTATTAPINPTATPTATAAPINPTATPTPTALPANPTATPTAATQPGSRVEFTGQIQAIGETSWVVGGRTIRVDGNTEIDEEDGQAVVGAWAEVHAVVESEGGLYARKFDIKEGAEETPEATRTPHATRTPEPTHTPEATRTSEPTHIPEPTHTPHVTRTPEATRTPEHEMEVEWEGAIESIGPVTWTVASRTFLIDANTVVDSREGPAVVGAWAKVKAISTNADDLLALHIRIKDRVPDGAKVEFRGAIEAMSPTNWVVAGRTLTLDEFTIIGHPERAGVGAIAEVKARRLDDQSLLAIEIEIEGWALQMGQRIEWVGLLEQFSAASWTVGGRTVQLNASTKIEGVPRLGDRVEVQAQKQADGTLLALRLHVAITENTAEWRGIVDNITATTWQISGRSVTVNAQTVFDERYGPLDVGVRVEVKALRQTDGSLLALRIRTED